MWLCLRIARLNYFVGCPTYVHMWITPALVGRSVERDEKNTRGSSKTCVWATKRFCHLWRFSCTRPTLAAPLSLQEEMAHSVPWI